MTRTIAAREGAGVVQVEAEVIGNTAVGAYRHLTLVTPGLAELARPGQFVALAGHMLQAANECLPAKPMCVQQGAIDIEQYDLLSSSFHTREGHSIVFPSHFTTFVSTISRFPSCRACPGVIGCKPYR